jgi:hypothetical protein
LWALGASVDEFSLWLLLHASEKWLRRRLMSTQVQSRTRVGGHKVSHLAESNWNRGIREGKYATEATTDKRPLTGSPTEIPYYRTGTASATLGDPSKAVLLSLS